MALISDDETREVDAILQQRQHKGALEYQVRWKDAGSSLGRETWEPAKSLVSEYTEAVKAFTKSLKGKTKKPRSTSRSRKTSRSRSRSSSRSRKAAVLKADGKVTPKKLKSDTVKGEKSEGESSRSTRSSRSRTATLVVETVVTSVTQESSGTSSVGDRLEKNMAPAAENNDVSSVRSRKELEVQRVHNEQRPVRNDDLKPRSAIWKVADYAVIVLFVVSLIAALFMFLEKLFDLEEFKKQAFPSMSVLQVRLDGVRQNLVDFANVGVQKFSYAWDYLAQLVVGSPSPTSPASPPKDL